jgi:hypothetical protein
MPSLDPANPWGWDAFGDEVPKVDAPAPFKPAERAFPEEDRLFKVQKDALRAVQTARVLADSLRGKDDKAYREARQLLGETEDTYRAIRGYLDKYLSPGVSGIS